MKFGWINGFGGLVVITMLIPNIIYAVKNQGKENNCKCVVINAIEQIGRYSSMALMCVPLLVWEFGFQSVADIIPMPDDFDIENYTKEVFFMFSGEKVLVDLRCDNSLMKTMVDRFGEEVTTLAYDMTSFRIKTEVSASPTFFGWVFGFNGKVQILAPESVKEQYRQMIAQADEGMQQKENKEQEI